MGYPYIILDSRSVALARGYLESPVDSPLWYIKVLDGGEKQVMDHEYLQLVSLDQNAPAKMAHILRNRDNVVVVEPVEDLDSDVRVNLRVQVKFETHIFPGKGSKRKGRLKAISQDLSCGGISFCCDAELQEKEQLEIVIPITTNPLVLRIQVLRRRPSNETLPMYSAKFVDMVREEEAMVREAVFGQQIQSKMDSEEKED